MGGKVSCTLGEVKNRADLIIYWGGNPAECHPRHFTKYTIMQKGKFVKGRKDRTMVLVDIRDKAQRDWLVAFPELQQRAVSVPLEDVRACEKTILISSGATKHHATLGALRGKLARLLVCDIDCAHWLLAQ